MSKTTVFIAMPFISELDDLWEIGILETLSKLGYECVRADQLTTPGFIMSQVFEQIARADLVIGEMSGRNSNVFYEIGFAHALGKPTILLAKSKEDLEAFNTQGFRHFLHNGKVKRVREILNDILPGIVQNEVWPDVPGGKVVYEWPSTKYDPPNFQWKSQLDDKNLQIDRNGGQSVVSLDQIGKSILVSNTEKYWNHHSGSSIMCLMSKTNSFEYGDKVMLLLSGRATGSLQLGLIGDGGRIDEDPKKWACSWKDRYISVEDSPSWSTWVVQAIVKPTEPSYNPGQHGTTVYLMSSVGSAIAYFKKIQLIHIAKI